VHNALATLRELRKSSPTCTNALPQQIVAVLFHSFAGATSTDAVENIAREPRHAEQDLATTSQVTVRKRRKHACPQAYADTIHNRCGQLHVARERTDQNITTMMQVPVAKSPSRACPQAYPGRVHNSCGELARTYKNSAHGALFS
jgi:hypothetical protein